MKVSEEFLPRGMVEEVRRRELRRVLSDPDKELDYADLVVESVDEMYRFWDEDGPDHFLDWFEWDQDMGRFRLLEELRQQGRLSKAQEARFEKIKAKLEGKKELMQYMKLSEPGYRDAPRYRDAT